MFASADNLGAMFADVVRLSFHDAGTFDPSDNTGGADGCVDLDAPENNGLAPIIDALSVVVSGGNLSRADVWALAATMAIEAAGGPRIEFQIGRSDASSCHGHGDRLPNAELGHSHILEVMVTKLSFSERETAALMGAHVLGQATRSISGYDGPWVPRNARFSNLYFEDLIGRPWNREAQPSFGGESRNQWNGGGGTMMLNTDIELAFDTSNGCTRAGGGGQVRGRRCPRAVNAFSEAVTEFAQRGGEQAFFETFGVAFKKLLALGSVGLTCLFPDCVTPGSL
jgi:catalase (peroxidase I)